MEGRFRKNKRRNKTKGNVGSNVDLKCEPCLFDGTHEKAVGFCKTCVEYLCHRCIREHKKAKMTRQHSVVTDMLPEHPDVVKEMKKMICCPHHPEMTVTARCIGHDVYLCPVCFTDTHRRCEIVKLSERKTDEQEAKYVRRSLDDIASMACSIKTKVENNKKSIAADKERVKKEISVQVRHIKDTVKTLEIKAQQDVDNVLEQTLFGMDEVINETENIEKEIVRNRSLLDAAIQFGTDNDDKCLADLLMSKMAPLRERATTLYEKPHLKLEFKTNTPFTDMPSLGNVNAFEKEEKLNPPNGSQIDLSSDVLEDEQRSATPEDSYDGYDDDLSCISFDNDLEEQGSTTPEDSYDDDLHSISSDERDPEARHDIREDNDKKPCTILKYLY